MSDLATKADQAFARKCERAARFMAEQDVRKSDEAELRQIRAEVRTNWLLNKVREWRS